MLDWIKVTVITNHRTGKDEITYSHTPAEFVAELQRRNEHIIVTARHCSECIFTPEGLSLASIPQEAADEALLHLRWPECVCVTVARRLRSVVVPDFVMCYAFYYQYWHKSPYLRAAKDANLITFHDVTNLPGPQASGLIVVKPYVK